MDLESLCHQFTKEKWGNSSFSECVRPAHPWKKPANCPQLKEVLLLTQSSLPSPPTLKNLFCFLLVLGQMPRPFSNSSSPRVTRCIWESTKYHPQPPHPHPPGTQSRNRSVSLTPVSRSLCDSQQRTHYLRFGSPEMGPFLGFSLPLVAFLLYLLEWPWKDAAASHQLRSCSHLTRYPGTMARAGNSSVPSVQGQGFACFTFPHSETSSRGSCASCSVCSV